MSKTGKISKKPSRQGRQGRQGRQKTIMIEPILVHCNGCGNDFVNIDGCPDCGTTRYLTVTRNQ